MWCTVEPPYYYRLYNNRLLIVQQMNLKHHLFPTSPRLFIKDVVGLCVNVYFFVVSIGCVLVWTGACWSPLMLVMIRAKRCIFVGGNYSQLWNAGRHDGSFRRQLKKSSKYSLWKTFPIFTVILLMLELSPAQCGACTPVGIWEALPQWGFHHGKCILGRTFLFHLWYFPVKPFE